jgi:hypothetical protein
MKHIPEEFYRKSKHCVLRPDNTEAFLQIHKRWCELKGKTIQWQFWEHDAGSSRTSATAFSRGLWVGPPIDARYGWDYNDNEHRDLLDKIHRQFKPIVEHHAPECTDWCKGSAQRKPDELQASRDKQIPALTWRRNHILARHRSG